MFTTRSLGHAARTALVVLPFAAMACRPDDESSSPTIRVAEASEPETPPAVTPAPTGPELVTAVVSDVAFETGDDAYKAGKFREAARLYRLHASTKPTDAHGFYMLGLASWKGGDFEGARSAFDKSIALDSGFAKSYFNAARVLLDMKRAPEALELVVRGLTIDSTSPDGWRLRARAQSENGDVFAATETYKAMLMNDDADAWGLNNYGMFLLSHNCVQESLGPLARAVQVRPTAPLFLNNFGMALERAGYLLTALTYYEAAVRHDSTFSKAVRNAERLRNVEVDASAPRDVNVAAIAEEFRLKVKGWKAETTPR